MATAPVPTPNPNNPVPATPPPGLINSTPAPITTVATPNSAGGVQGAQAGQVTGTVGYSPNAFEVKPDQTVAGQIKGLIDQDSPLMQQAEARARTAANSRGLINSSMAVGAGHAALYDAALPIAAADAATHERAATNTTTAQNTALGFGADASNRAGLQNAASITQTGLANLQAASAELQQKLQTSGQIAAIEAKGAIDTRITELTNKNKLLLQTSAGAAQMYNQMTAEVARIMQNDDLSWESKMTAMNNLVEGIDGALATMTTIGNIPGVESTLRFGDGEWK